MTSYHFQEISIRPQKRGKCSVCGKRRQRTKEFSQTLNPWNKNSKGHPKTWQEIDRELSAQASEWLKEPLICRGCSDDC